MIAVRYAYVLALVLWLGGMAALGAIVAPSTFEVLEGLVPDGGRALAAAVFGAALHRFQYVAYACGAVVLAALAAMRLLGPKPVGFAARSAIAAAMLGVALYTGLVVYRSLDAVQRDIGAGVSPATLAASDARRVRFDELHALSTRLMMVNMAGALVLLYWQARE
jgi:hypothetical protein